MHIALIGIDLGKNYISPGCSGRAQQGFTSQEVLACAETMPDVLWLMFREDRHLAAALSPMAARIIQTRISIRSGLRVGVMAILHTFNGKLESIPMFTPLSQLEGFEIAPALGRRQCITSRTGCGIVGVRQ